MQLLLSLLRAVSPVKLDRRGKAGAAGARSQFVCVVANRPAACATHHHEQLQALDLRRGDLLVRATCE
jgi:hypothetical protein